MNGGWLLVIFCCHSDEGLHSTATMSCVIFAQSKGFRQGSDWWVCCPTAEGHSQFGHSIKSMFSTFAASCDSVMKDSQDLMATKVSEFHQNTARCSLLIHCSAVWKVEPFLTEWQIARSEGDIEAKLLGSL